MLSETGAPISAPPPQSFNLSHHGSNSDIIDKITRTKETVLVFFSPPQLPEGFEMAKPASVISNFATSIAAFLGFGAKKAKVVSPVSPVLPPSGAVSFDFDNDAKADISQWRSSSGEWSVKKSSDNSVITHTLGSSSTVIAPADFDTDGVTDFAVFDAAHGTWTIRQSSTNTNQTISDFGQTGDTPLPADYDGDGRVDAAVWRSSNGTWYVKPSSGGNIISTQFGTSGDIPVPGNYDGDSAMDYAVFRPSTGDWHVLASSNGYSSAHWGISSDIPVPADYDGDNITDYAVYRSSTGTWYAYKSSGAGQYIAQNWGNYGDQPVPADFDGDNQADLAVWRPTTANWLIFKSCNYNNSCGSDNYEYAQFGFNGDLPAVASYLKKVGASVHSYALAKARLSPKNSTGGTNLYSRNFSWEASLINLRGRAGLNAGFGIGYNSLVWAKEGANIYFDPDNSNVSPGFRFGFPVIEQVYYNDSGSRTYNYLMVSPSGERTEFRQVNGASDTYETADSSYRQLKTIGASNPNSPVGNITITVTGTEGTKMTFQWKAGAFRCSQIKDRNGNYITIEHDEYGLLRSVTDTLNRVITVNYDSEFYPTSITQTWKNSNGEGSNTTHTWATFTYAASPQINTNFDTTAITNVFGPPNGTTLKVLQKITYAAGGATQFDYNSYGQVWKIRQLAADSSSHILNYVRTNLETPASNQTDCPRFSETYNWVENFNVNQNGQAQEVLIKNTYTEGVTYTLPNNSQATGTLVEVKSPDGNGAADKLVNRIYAASSGWAENLPVLNEDWADEGGGLSKKRSVWSSWTQDNTGVSYILNPRVVETKISDGATTKRTETEYLMQAGSSTVAQYGLVSAFKVYDTDQSTVLKTQTIGYNLNSNYVSRRIIGLPSETKSYQGTTSGTLISKVTYEYDENGYSASGQSVSATQHDNTNYGTGFVYRGNSTGTTRWDVTNPTNNSLAVTSSAKFNITGSRISLTDARGRVTSLSYADVWNDSVSRSTYAFPTTVTDSGGNSTTAKYRFDIGANVWARSPTPSGAGNSYGKTTSRIYSDTTGRLTKEKIENSISGAYVRYEYPSNETALNTYITVVDANGDNNINSADEVLTETLLDGAGRVRKTRTENPNSTGGYTGKLIEYSVLGQLKRETVPTEINSSWNPSGDDYRGMSGSDYIWLWNSFERDWMGRITKETNTDGTDKLFSYTGCGCAGGQVITVKGEVTTATDVAGNQQTTKRRTQKIYQDILGRTVKTELWDLDGAGTAPYSTTVNTYNGRNQITNIRQYSGSDTSTTFQNTTMTFDGHGRLASRHLPNYDANTSITWTYHPDDTIATITDPRGAGAAYQYGHIDDASSSEYRELLTKVTYSVPQNSTIPVPAPVSFSYDAAGNRAQMQEGSGGTGTLTYSYDELSRLKSETKVFSDTLADAPAGGYKLQYTYHLTGGLKSIQDPFGAVVTYASDKIGRLTAIGGSGFYDDFAHREITSYMSGISYRAFGGVKSMTAFTDDTSQVTLNYNTRLKPSSYQVASSANTDDVQNATYSYYNDGKIKEVNNGVGDQFSQEFDYDFAGRVSRNEFDSDNSTTTPFKQTLGYDAFNNITSRSTWTWSFTQRSFTASYTNHRKTSGGYNSSVDTYDAAGNVLTNGSYNPTNDKKWKYDAAGRMTDWEETYEYFSSLKDEGAAFTLDGDGRVAKKIERVRDRHNGNTTYALTPAYSIFSSVTGQEITTLTSSGQKHMTFVYMGGSIIAEQTYGAQSNSEVVFKHSDPVTGSVMQTQLSGELSPNGTGRVDLGALGTVVPPQEDPEFPTPQYRLGGYAGNPESGCQWNGAPVKCSLLSFALRTTKEFDVYDLSRGTSQFSFSIIPRQYDGPIAPDTPDNPDTPEDEGVIRGGSTVKWYELHMISSDDAAKKIESAIITVRRYIKMNPNCENFLKKVLNEIRPNRSLNSQSLQKDSTGRLVFGAIGIDELLDLGAKAQVIETGESGVVKVGGENMLNPLRAEPGKIYVNKSFYGRSDVNKGFDVLHESFHQIEGVDDLELARAVQVAANSDRPPDPYPDTEDGRNRASDRINRIIGNRCGLDQPRDTHRIGN